VIVEVGFQGRVKRMHELHIGVKLAGQIHKNIQTFPIANLPKIHDNCMIPPNPFQLL
jgi:hypothetical protein